MGPLYLCTQNLRPLYRLSLFGHRPGRRYLSENGEAPLLIAEEVVNYRMGDGYLCYTKDGNIYLYDFETGKTAQLNTSISRGMLASASGGEVCWYDVTSAKDVDVVKYAKVK